MARLTEMREAPEDSNTAITPCDKGKQRETCRESVIMGNTDIDVLLETIIVEQHQPYRGKPITVAGTGYADIGTLLESATQDALVAESLTCLIHDGNLAMSHRSNLFTFLWSIRDRIFNLPREAEGISREQVLELREALVAANEKAAEWQTKYAEAVLQRTIEMQASSPSPSQSRPEESPKVEDVSSRPVRPIQKCATLPVDTSDCDILIPRKQKAKARKPTKDPEMLSDGKIVTYEAWEVQMKNKLKRDHEEYPTEKEKVAFIFSRTTAKASEVLPRSQIVTAKAAFKVLSAWFQDLHRKSEAQAAFKKLHIHQGGDYYTFHNEFIKLALASGLHLDLYKEEFAKRLPRGIRTYLLALEQDKAFDFDMYQELASKNTKIVRSEKRVQHPKNPATTSTN